MNGAFGHKIFNGTGLAYTNMSSFPDYNVLKGAPEKNIVDQNVSDYWLEKGDYLNFEYLTLGYDIPITQGRGAVAPSIGECQQSCHHQQLQRLDSDD